MIAVEEDGAPGASAAAIQQHYDAGNEFFALWLDETLSYSCALWTKDDDDLHAAQNRKIDYHVAQAGVEHSRRMLDIGCGWGAVLRRSVEHWKVSHAVGLTLSQAQVDYLTVLRDRRIEVHLMHWADYEPGGTFDGITSIGAFEHFARFGDTQSEKVDNYRRFFEKCHKWLAAGKSLSLQTIAYGDVARGHVPSDLFIANEVFPESELPRLADIAEASEPFFEIECVRNDRQCYARTLRCWFDRLRANRAEAVALVGETMVQRYERYLRMFIYGFQLGSLVLYRVTLRRIDVSRQSSARPETALTAVRT